MRRSADATQPPQPQQQQQQQQQHNTAAVAAEMAELRARAEEAERVAKEERRRSLALRTELERERAKHAKALEVEAERTASALAAAADAKTTADKLARRERRLLDQQSQWADAQLTTKKGREELERATTELEEVKSAARAQDRRHKMETERLRSRNGDLSSRVNELEDEVRRLGVAKLAAEERAAAAADAATRRERRSVAEVPTSSAPMTMSMSTTSSSGAIAAKAAASPASPLRASEPAAPSGKRAPRVVRFPNGTVKETRADGVMVVGFTNGDLKVQRTDGTVEYYYAEVGTWHASNSSGNGAPELYFFPGGQAEAHFVGGSKEILFPDGACRLVDANGEEEDVPPAEAPVRLRALAALRGGPPSRPHGTASEIAA